MEILAFVIGYLIMVYTSVSLMVWDWTNDGLDVDIQNISLFIMLSSAGWPIFVPFLGIKYIFTKMGFKLPKKVLFKGKR